MCLDYSEAAPHNRSILCKLSLMLTTLLDVNHDNSIYYNNNNEIMINGSSYIFKNEIGRVVTWDFLLDLIPELKNILVDIVELTKITNGHIIESSI